MARSTVFGWVRRCMLLADAANQPGAPPVDELVERNWERLLGRREFLRAATVTTLVTSGGRLLGPLEALAGLQASQVAKMAVSVASM